MRLATGWTPVVSAARHYRAFISYSHADARLAERLHRSLEKYRVPRRLRAAAGEFGPIPETLAPIFCDREDLASAGDLSAGVRGALAQSDALIVVCSPEAARSRWVNEEVLSFKRDRDPRRVYSVIIGGEPNAGDERECFPPALRFELDADGTLGTRPANPVAADLRPGKDGATRGRLKLIAGLLGVDLDTLRQREAQRRYRHMLWVTMASLAGMALALFLATIAWIERNNARREQARAEVASGDAQRRQAQAEGLLGFLLDDLRPKLEKVGRLDLLDTVDDRAAKYFATLPASDLNDPTLTRQAQTLTAIGQVRLSQARFADALESFREAYERSSALAERHKGDGALLYDRGQAEYWVGYVHWQSRDLDAAQEWLTRYRDTSRAVFALDPGNADWEHELAYGDHNLAVLEFERGQLDEAAAGFERARERFESLLARTPDEAQLAFELADERSWQGNVQEQLGHLERATELLADKAERLRAISARNPNVPKWKVQWSTAQVMQSELLRVRGRHAEALAVANESVERLKPLTVLDPGNKVWAQDYLHALLNRARARVGAAKADEARSDLAQAQTLLAALEHGDDQDRYRRRDLLDAGTLRILLALHAGDDAAARAAAGELHVAEDVARDGVPTSAEDAGRLALSQIAVGMAAATAGRHSDAEAHYASARRVLEPWVKASRYWRVLDPWLRVARAAGDGAEATRVESVLAADGYVPLFPWPPAAQPGRNSRSDGRKDPARSATPGATGAPHRAATRCGPESDPTSTLRCLPQVADATPRPRLQPQE